MSMIRSVKAGGQQQFAPIPLLEEDSYPGRIIRLVDLGTHPGTEMDGTPKLKKDREGNVKFGSDGKPLVKYDRRLLLTILRSQVRSSLSQVAVSMANLIA